MFNPAAGRPRRPRAVQVAELAAGLARRGWQVEIAETTASAGAAGAARQGIADGVDVLVACGGDGTVNEVANQLAAQQQSMAGASKVPALAVAPPWGTANIFAHALGVPRSPHAAAAWLAQARPQARPLGMAETSTGRRFFIALASAGYDAAVVHALSSEHKRHWGKLAFAWKAATLWRSYFPAPLAYEADGMPGQADGIIVGLTRYYGGRLRLGAPDPDRGLTLALRGSPRLLPWQGLALLTTGLEHARGVARLQPAAIRIITPGVPVEVDGEPAGCTPASFAIAARLQVLK
ncbi:MAG: diacylglycerol/lipid kinase family protein [Terriglobales bacterium]